MTSPIINLSALEPLYLPHEMPSFHRIRAEREGEPARIVKGRRPSDIVIAQNLRRYVMEWRETDYAGASDTTRELRLRITSHKRVMVINDEAHHVWDPDSAWNEAITYLNADTIRSC